MQESCSEEVQNEVRQSRKDDPLRIMQEIKVWPYYSNGICINQDVKNLQEVK